MIKIFDVTLRDGSYINKNYIFSEQEKNSYLNNHNEFNEGFVKYYEFGHGLGSLDKIINQKSGFDLYKINKKKKIKVGIFTQPSYFKDNKFFFKILWDKIDFIKIGISNFKDCTKIEEHINFLKKNNVQIFFFIKQCHRYSPKKIKDFIIKIQTKYNINNFFLADSLGVLNNSDIINYEKVIRAYNKNINLGFHGHDNFGNALSNSIAAINNNYKFIDCTSNGMGRSCGNTVLELLLTNLFKKNKNKLIKELKNYEKYFKFKKVKKIKYTDIKNSIKYKYSLS